MTTGLRSAMPCVVALTIILLSGCASSDRPPAPRMRPSSAALTDLRRLVVVTTGESRFTVLHGVKEPGRSFDDVVKWLPGKDILAPIARALYSGLSWLIDADRAERTVPRDVVPGTVVAEAFARALQVSGPFNQIVPMDPRDPLSAGHHGAAKEQTEGECHTRQGSPVGSEDHPCPHAHDSDPLRSSF